MTEQPMKKGMSKGCLVSLIIVGALVVMVVIAGVTCYMKRAEIAKFGVKTMVTGLKTQVNDNPVEGIDTAMFNAVSDAFLVKLEQTELDVEKLGQLAQTIQPMISDEAIDSAEAVWYLEALVEYYPDIGEFLPEVEQLQDSVEVLE